MRLIGNVLWLAIAGLWLALAYVLAGIVWSITIVGLPFGVQSFKLAGYSLWPFGRVVVSKGGDQALSTVGNVLWLLITGWALALGHVITGLLLCLTIIGIPLGVANFKLAVLALWPMGREIVSVHDPRATHGHAVRPLDERV